MRTLANSEVPNEMPQTAVFHQCLNFLLKLKTIFSERSYTIPFGNYNLSPLDIYYGPPQVCYIKPEGRINY